MMVGMDWGLGVYYAVFLGCFFVVEISFYNEQGFEFDISLADDMVGAKTSDIVKKDERNGSVGKEVELSKQALQDVYSGLKRACPDRHFTVLDKSDRDFLEERQSEYLEKVCFAEHGSRRCFKRDLQYYIGFDIGQSRYPDNRTVCGLPLQFYHNGRLLCKADFIREMKDEEVQDTGIQDCCFMRVQFVYKRAVERG